MTGAELFYEMVVWLLFAVVVNTANGWIFLTWWAICNFKKLRKRNEKYICEYGYNHRSAFEFKSINFKALF